MILDVMMATHTEGFEVARKIPETPELKHMHVLLVTGVTKDMHLPFGFEPDETLAAGRPRAGKAHRPHPPAFRNPESARRNQPARSHPWPA